MKQWVTVWSCPRRRQKLAALFRTRTRDEWCVLLKGSDACSAPVLSMTEAAGARSTLRSHAETASLRGCAIGQDSVELLRGLGHKQEEIEALCNAGVIHRPD